MAKIPKKSAIFGVCGLLASCASYQKDYSYMQGRDYASRDTLKESLVGVDPSKWSESDLQRMLNGKIVLPKNVKLAVVRLPDPAQGAGFENLDNELRNRFYDRANWGGRVVSVIPMPQVLVSRPASLPSLRLAAAYLQADLLLVISPAATAEEKFEWFADNKAKATATLEVMLLDVRTSTIPFTALSTETAEVAKIETDYSDASTRVRALHEAEKKALMGVSAQIKEFLARMP